MQNIYERYAELKRTQALLADEIESINKQIIEDLEENHQKQVVFDYGKFTKSSRKTYKYSKKVKSLQDKVKLEQIKEQEKGIAEVVESHYLTFTPKKDDN